MPDRHSRARFLGIDIGTSGVRVAALDEEREICGSAACPFRDRQESADPAAWWRGIEKCFEDLRRDLSLSGIAAIAVDGTSGTVLAIDRANEPVGRALMYDEASPDLALVTQLEAVAPADSPALGKQSPLARAAFLARQPNVARIVHQADWVAMRLGDGQPIGDENNALKTGYDLAEGRWPDWISEAGIDIARLPEIVPAGTPICRVGSRARALGLPSSALLVSGTTDGCASFLATGADRVGEAVTALGSTLVLKLLSDREIKATRFGVYSHRIKGMWLAGGASNTGGAVIRAYFPDERLAELSAQLDPDAPTGLNYYPLLHPGERFPVSDAKLAPRLEPRPRDDATFFQGILEGIAAIEKEGYERLAELGAPPLKSVRSVGGGASNAAWTRIRQRLIGVPFEAAASVEAAAGTARLAYGAVSS